MRWLLSAILGVTLLTGLPCGYAFAQTTVDYNTSTNNINQFVLPGASGYGGTTNNTSTNPSSGSSHPVKYGRTWFNPMNLPGVSGPIYYGGPVRFGKELLDVGLLIRFKPEWDSGFAQKFANRPGKVKVSESIPTPKEGISGGPVTMTLHQPQSDKKLRDFNRSYELVDCFSADGSEGADSPKLMGMAAESANKKGAAIGIVVNQGANFELYGRDSQQVIGFSPSIMGGGTGSVAGGAMGFALGWAQHHAKYLTEPFLVVLMFKWTGVPYDWTPEPEKVASSKKPLPAVPPNGGQYENGDQPEKSAGQAEGTKGAKDVAPAKGPKLPYKRPAPSLLIEQQQP
jgi:hypothetical protein